MTTSMRSDSTGTYGALQIGGTDVMRYGSDTSGQLSGFRNRVINGSCDVAQRGTVALVNNAWTYGGCDRIAVAPSGFTTLSGNIQQVGNFSRYGQFAQYASMTTTGTGNLQFQTRIEAKDVADLNGRQVIVSAYVHHIAGTSVNAQITLHKANAIDNFSSVTTAVAGPIIPIANDTVTHISATVQLGNNDATNGLALTVQFIGIGAVTSKAFAVFNLQLEEGSIATPFEHRPVGIELSLCQRYYETGYAAYSHGTAATEPVWPKTQFTSFKVSKRSTPTVGYSSWTREAAGATAAVTSPIINVSSIHGFRFYDSDSVVDHFHLTWTASAEL